MARTKRASRGKAPEHPIPEPSIPRATKRKATEESPKPKKKSNKSSLEAREELDFEGQYCQGRYHDHPAMESLGCGWCTLMTDDLKSILPFKGDAHLEVQTGIRLSERHSGVSSSRTFMVPIPHIEEIFTRTDVEKSAPREEAIQFIIIPTAMTGASSIRHELPLPLIFNVPDTKATGKMLEYGKGEKLHAAIIEKVFNAEFSRINKVAHVQHLPALSTEDKNSNGFGASWQASSDQFNESTKAREKHLKGSLYLTTGGILFLAEDITRTIYLPFRSIEKLTVLVIKDLASARKDVQSHIVGDQSYHPSYRTMVRGGAESKQREGEGLQEESYDRTHTNTIESVRHDQGVHERAQGRLEVRSVPDEVLGSQCWYSDVRVDQIRGRLMQEHIWRCAEAGDHTLEDEFHVDISTDANISGGLYANVLRLGLAKGC